MMIITRLRMAMAKLRGIDPGWAGSWPIAPVNGIDVAAMTVWGESRGETSLGQMAVASVILNRAQWKGSTGLFMRGADPASLETLTGRIRAACLARAQFSCWSKGVFVQAKPYQCQPWTDCCNLSKGISSDGFTPVVSSVYYHADYIPAPSWTKGMEVERHIGKHIFYKAQTP